MEIRQLRYFIRVVELGSMGKAAQDLGVVTSALSQQISRLESELSTRLLQRTSTGVIPTDAGIAFFRQAQLALRHVDEAARAAQQARLSGHVSIGLAPTTASVMGLPLIQAMRERYPEVRFHAVEALSGHLAAMLNARQLDLAILFNAETGRRWSTQPLLDERLFIIAAQNFPGFPEQDHAALADIAHLPLAMPTNLHGLRASLVTACRQQGLELDIALEIDSLAMLMDAVRAGIVATIQPGAAMARPRAHAFQMAELIDEGLIRRNLLASLSDEELSPAALATRVVMRDVALAQVRLGNWQGATLHEP
ncbi:LysR family transcriptional regulator [Pusillimonas sp. TS35]|uniref:LysR family transcriptional regulator n=1 Tax=Paracandidimonas lactea TaxID=2895524 RepID=UPI00136FFBA7|nr:LysR family transcriptional regulator [Paracandidimonas lactea]MYN13338.1 LysR family transcriptional regulator [Pusillimonas sp. TS35]